MPVIFPNPPQDSARSTGLPSSGFPKPHTLAFWWSRSVFLGNTLGQKPLCVYIQLFAHKLHLVWKIIWKILDLMWEHSDVETSCHGMSRHHLCPLLLFSFPFHFAVPPPPCPGPPFLPTPPPFWHPCFCLLLISLLLDLSALHIICPQHHMQILLHPLHWIAVASDPGGLGECYLFSF